MRKIKQLLVLVISLICISSVNCQILPQEQSMWCWASCIQSSLAQGNVYQSQTQIVARLTGWPQDRPAQINEVIAVLRSYYFRAWSVDYPASAQDLYNTLVSGWKLIAFVNPSNNPQVGHFIMLQGIDGYGQVVISDPANGITYTQVLDQLYNDWNWSRSIVVGAP